MYKSILIVIVCLSLGACTRLGGHMERRALPSGAPAVETILADLAANDKATRNFRATGTFVLKSPDLASTQLLRESSIQFRPPSSLYVVGRKYASTVFRLTTAGEKFLIEMPTEKQYCYSSKGERIKGVSVDVSPSAIAKELFLPEEWTELSLKHVSITDYDPARQTATLEIATTGIRKRPHRRVMVEGTPWIVRRSELLDRDGSVLAVTTKDEYHEMDGIRFPTKVESTFPGQDALMRFEMRKVFLNTQLDEAAFDIDTHLRDVQDKGYERIEPHTEKENER